MGQTNWTQTFEVLVEIKYNVSETQPGPGMKYTNARDEAPRLRPGLSAVPETPPCPSSLAWDSSGLAPVPWSRSLGPGSRSGPTWPHACLVTASHSGWVSFSLLLILKHL